jgi:hypothetical protein
MPELKNVNVISMTIMIEGGMKSMSNIPQTDFTKVIEVNAYDAKEFIGHIQDQINILNIVNKFQEAKHWEALKVKAEVLLKVKI